MNNYALVYFAGVVISMALLFLPPKWLAEDLKLLNASVRRGNENVSPGVMAVAFTFCYLLTCVLWFIFWPLYIKDKVLE